MAFDPRCKNVDLTDNIWEQRHSADRRQPFAYRFIDKVVREVKGDPKYSDIVRAGGGHPEAIRSLLSLSVDNTLHLLPGWTDNKYLTARLRVPEEGINVCYQTHYRLNDTDECAITNTTEHWHHGCLDGTVCLNYKGGYECQCKGRGSQYSGPGE